MASMLIKTLEDRMRRLLPEQYQSPAEPVAPVSMGSAPLRFGPDGRVAWDLMWATFCDLAMAGGPPHKGTLLAPATPTEAAAQPGRYAQVVDEICRGITLVTQLEAAPAGATGWVRVQCPGAGMAAWLLRAITMENIAVRAHGSTLLLPAGPHFRLEKEIKNVITVIAKTCHYWRDHMTPARREDITQLLETMQAEAPCLQPGQGQPTPELLAQIAATSVATTYPGWLGLEQTSVPVAIHRMRLLIATNVLARREGTRLFVPLNPIEDPNGLRIKQALSEIQLLS